MTNNMFVYMTLSPFLWVGWFLQLLAGNHLHDYGSRRHSVCCFGARALRDDNAAIGNCGYKGADVDDPLPKRSLADDPTFLARLAELDRGLNAGLDEGEKKQFPPPRQKPSGPVPAPPPRA